MAPMEMIKRYSADAVRYWAASTGTGKDAVISEEKISAGAKLVTKLWNVANFSRRFLDGYQPPEAPPELYPTDAWLLSRLQRLIERATASFQSYQYAPAEGETETFFWGDLADNYLELAKRRLYDGEGILRESARYALYYTFLTVLKLFAPIMPYITDEIYRSLFASGREGESIHRSAWPAVDRSLVDEQGEETGRHLLQLAREVREYKSANRLSLGAELDVLQVYASNAHIANLLRSVEEDIRSVTRARRVEVSEGIPADLKHDVVPRAFAVSIKQ